MRELLNAIISRNTVKINKILNDHSATDLISFKTEDTQRNALHICAMSDDDETFMYLIRNSNISNSFLLSEMDGDERTPIYHAIGEKNVNLIKKLFNAETREFKNLVNLTDKNGRNPLHIAAYLGSTEIVKIILDNSDEKNLQKALKKRDNATKQTPLEYALDDSLQCLSGVINAALILEKLNNFDAKIIIKHKSSTEILEHLIKNGSEKAIKNILEYKPNIFKRIANNISNRLGFKIFKTLDIADFLNKENSEGLTILDMCDGKIANQIIEFGGKNSDHYLENKLANYNEKTDDVLDLSNIVINNISQKYIIENFIRENIEILPKIKLNEANAEELENTIIEAHISNGTKIDIVISTANNQILILNDRIQSINSSNETEKEEHNNFAFTGKPNITNKIQEEITRFTKNNVETLSIEHININNKGYCQELINFMKENPEVTVKVKDIDARYLHQINSELPDNKLIVAQTQGMTR